MSARLVEMTDWPVLARRANYSTATLAAQCGISIRQLEREFLRTKGQTPEQWINELRLQDARELLGEGMSIKNVAMSLKYKHSQSLSRAFKQYFGVPPSGVRDQIEQFAKSSGSQP